MHPWGAVGIHYAVQRIRPTLRRAMVERWTGDPHASLTAGGPSGQVGLERPGIGCSEVSGAPGEAPRRRGKRHA